MQTQATPLSLEELKDLRERLSKTVEELDAEIANAGKAPAGGKVTTLTMKTDPQGFRRYFSHC